MADTQQILDSVDAFLLAHRTWADNDVGPAVPTAAYEIAVHNLMRECDGDVPARCREIVTAVNRLIVEWNAYARGERRTGRQGDQPHPALWAAVEHLGNVRKGASWRIPPIPEPVDYLIEQKVSLSQIALHIYAHNGRGPFITGPGSFDQSLVLQEKAQPGSVCKDGWWEALHADDQRTAVASLRHSMERPEHMLTDPADTITEDKASVVQLLREQAFPQQIARVKKITVEEVFRIAKENGITPNEMPNLGATRAPMEPELPGAANIRTPSVTLTPAAPETQEPHVPNPVPASPTEAEATKERILEMIQSGKPAPEVAKELGCKVQKVTAVWREHQKRLAEQAGADGIGDDDGDDDSEADFETSNAERTEGAAV